MINNLINTLLYVIFLLIFIKVLNKNIKINIRGFYVLIPLLSLSFISNSNDYLPIITLLYLLISIIFIKILFNYSLSKSLMIISIYFVNISIVDIFLSVLLIMFSLYEVIKIEYSIFSNIVIFSFSLLFLLNKNIRELYYQLLNKMGLLNKCQVIYVLLLILSSIVIAMAISKNNNLELLLLLPIIFISIVILNLISISGYKKLFFLSDKCKRLDNQMTLVEYEINRQNINIHEHKNQLSIIKGLNNKKEINSYIDEILSEYYPISENISPELNMLNSMSLKSLLQYKKDYANSCKVSFLTDISKNASFDKLSLKKEKILLNFLGIFLDNAIEAAANCNKGYVLIEIYKSNNRDVIVITNPISEYIELKKLDNKNYSTKGSNRGKGLYLVKELNKKYNYFNIKTNIKDNCFIKKITIKD